MKPIIFILLCAIVAISADDQVECLQLCNEKFVGTEAQKRSCSFGCNERGPIAKGMFGFRVCMDRCEAQYPNATNEDEQTSCKFACSLPFDQKFSMSVDFNSEKPHLRIEKETGSGIARMLGKSPSSVSTSLSDIIIRPKFISMDAAKFDDMDLNKIFSEANEIDNENARVMFVMDRLINNVMRQVHHDRMMAEKHIFSSRPSGHDEIAFLGPQVGNFIENDKPIITSFEFVTAKPKSFYSYGPHSLRWLVLTFSVLFLAISILCVVIFFCRSGAEEYVRMRHNFRQTHSTVTGPLPEKKSAMVEEGVSAASWADNQPDGDAPPAYDQLSIHSFKPAIKPQQQ
ncbi:unnamed protein product [Caenorhabditis bovis]|uniref:Uncharacterized protein n=1 Tax=Caenorhabditis bovis TaxID=2654633 RepID=A0A8S1EYD3_9PELO|nr:unnamed protein product [Caenorhabditis bovis]